MTGEAGFKTAGEGLVLFLCVANSARSQIAEGLAREIVPAGVRVASAGSEPGQINPHAVAVLSEWGIDASGQYSKPISAIQLDRVTHAVTLCADELCPVFPAPVERFHWPHPDPAAAIGQDEEIRQAFRKVRDALDVRLRDFFGAPTREPA